MGTSAGETIRRHLDCIAGELGFMSSEDVDSMPRDERVELLAGIREIRAQLQTEIDRLENAQSQSIEELARDLIERMGALSHVRR